MKVLVDTNVALDILLNRSAFYSNSMAVFVLAEQKLTWDDLEDSVQFTVGEALSADFIVTRNTQDFASGSINAVTPEQFIQAITEISDNN
jgi:predicted nucleic acid-binding protein